MHNSGDYSIAVYVNSYLESCEEVKEFKNISNLELRKRLQEANFKLQFIESIKRFYLVTTSEFAIYDKDNPIIQKELLTSINGRTLTYSVYLRPIQKELHLIMVLSKTNNTTSAKTSAPSGVRTFCDYILPTGDIKNRFTLMARLRKMGWKCRTKGHEENRNIFGEKYITRTYYDDTYDGIEVLTLIK